MTMELKQRAKAASSASDTTLKTLAKQLVQVRQQRAKIQGAKAQLGAMGMHATVTASQIAAASAIGSVTEGMKTANKAMDARATAKIMTDFQRENERMQGPYRFTVRRDAIMVRAPREEAGAAGAPS